MQEYVRVKPDELKKLGKVVGKVRYLPQGVHTEDRNPDPKNELFIKEKKSNPYERRVIQ